MPTRGPEDIAHCVNVRMSVSGVGNLKTLIHSLDGIKTEFLANTVLEVTRDKFPTRIANFKSQRMCIMISLNEIDEYFVLGKIIPFVKPSAVGYPQ